MASFPSLKRVQVNDRARETGLTTVIAPDGSLFGQSLFSAEYFLFTPTFIDMTGAEVSTLQTFYVVNKLLAFDFDYVHRGMTTINYTCQFVTPGLEWYPTEAYNTAISSSRFIARCWFRGKQT